MTTLTYKYRIYPTKKQISILQRTFEECRCLYNYFLSQRKESYEKEKKSISRYDQQKQLLMLKKKCEFLNNTHSQVLQDVVKRVDLAFSSFFRRVKRKETPGYPRFKGKGWYDSITYPQIDNDIIKEDKIYLSKIGNVKIKLHREPKGKFKTCTVKKTSTNKYFVCIVCEINENKNMKKTGKEVGIDLGLTSFLTMSDSRKIKNPKFFKQEEKVLAKSQRKLSKLKKGSIERYNQKKVVSRIHERITNKRNNFTHQLSKKTVDEYDVICVEDLNIKNMKEKKGDSKDKRVRKSISDTSWNNFINKLSYKAENAGKVVVKVNPYHTSQMCNKCKSIKKLSLYDRIYKCNNCGNIEDRDVNASINILTLGLQSLYSEKNTRSSQIYLRE